MAITKGLWNIGGWNLPDFGISERLGIGPNNSAQALGGKPNPLQVNTTQKIGNRQVPTYISPTAYYVPGKPTLNTTVNTGSIPNNTTTGGNIPTNSLSTTTAPPVDPLAEARAAEERAAQERYNAENQQLNTEFDYAKAQLEGQLGTLGTQRDQSLAQVDLGLGDINRQVGTSKTNLQTNTQNQINQAGSTARNVQGQNRNVLRALGILNSSAAGQIMAKPMNQFDEQRAQLGQFLVQKTTELDDFVNQKVAEASQTKNQITAQYNDLVGKIQTDLRFNTRQRNDAIKAANAALSQHMASIAQSVQQYQQQAQLQKQQFQAAMAQALNYQNPTYNQQAITSLGLTSPTQQSQTAQMTPDELRRRQQQGLGGL